MLGKAVSDGTFRIHADGRPVYPMGVVCLLAPYAVVHHTSAAKIDPAIPFDVACIVGCGVTTGYGSENRCVRRRSARARTP